MKILVDLDETVVNLGDEWLARYNRDWNDNLTVDSITSWDWHLFAKPECGRDLYKYLDDPDLFTDLPPLEGAVEAVDELQRMGHRIVICTAPAFPSNATAKQLWCQKYLPFINRKDVCLIGNKYHVKADAIVDDSPVQVKKYASEYPDAKIYGIAYPYNEEAKDAYTLRAESWKDPAKAWKTILDHIRYEGGQ